MKQRQPMLLGLLASSLSLAAAFMAPSLPMTKHSIRSSGAARLRMSHGSNRENRSSLENTIKDLLLVKAHASVCFYMMEFFDEVKPRWLKEFEEQPDNRVQENGWETFLTNLMAAEPEEIRMKRPCQKPRGGSGNNPYLQQDRAFVEFSILIDPAALAKNMMVVREQLAEEWVNDLGLIRSENTELQRHHEDTVVFDKPEAERRRKLVFDHDPIFSTQSPYRGANYRELVNLTTKIALQRYEAEVKVRDRFAHNWIERFMVKKGANLEGNKLLEEMLNGPMVMINSKVSAGKGKPRVVEPYVIAQGIMEHRTAIADQFIVYLKDVPSDHFRLKRNLLERQLNFDLDEASLSDRRTRGFEEAA